jgi:dihydroorotase
VGARADLALFRLEEGSYAFHDVFMQPRHGTVQLVNTATYVGGTLLPHAPERPPAPWVATDLPAAQRLHGRR